MAGTSLWYAMCGAALESESAFDDRMAALSREIGARGRADAVVAADPSDSEQTCGLQPHAALREELGSLKVSALEQRALAEGASADATEDALDDDDPKAALIELVVLCADSSGSSSGEAELRRELEGLRLKELRARARSEDVGAEAMTAAMDSDDPKAALVEALVARRKV